MKKQNKPKSVATRKLKMNLPNLDKTIFSEVSPPIFFKSRELKKIDFGKIANLTIFL